MFFRCAVSWYLVDGELMSCRWALSGCRVVDALWSSLVDSLSCVLHDTLSSLGL